MRWIGLGLCLLCACSARDGVRADTSLAEPPAIDCYAALALGQVDFDASLGGTRAEQGFFQVRGAAPAPARTRRAPVRVALAGSEEVMAGKRLGLRVAFFNQGSERIAVLGPAAKSAERWAYPIYDVYVRDEAGVVFRYATRAESGVRALLPDGMEWSAQVIEPGHARDDVVDGAMPQLDEARIARAGRYQVWLVYNACGGMTPGYFQASASLASIGPRVAALTPFASSDDDVAEPGDDPGEDLLAAWEAGEPVELPSGAVSRVMRGVIVSNAIDVVVR
jgi:hypothetical protein